MSLSSSNPAAASLPATVSVGTGATNAAFTITTQPVTTSAAVTITATYNAVSRSAIVTVNPTSAGALSPPSLSAPASDARFAPGQGITFDWSDVPGAASYTIQIDDQDGFQSPLVNQTGAASQFTSSTLPTKRMWWRVRANSASGTAGNWSSVRRFEVK